MEKGDKELVQSLFDQAGYELTEDGVSYIVKVPNTDIQERFSGIGTVWDAYSKAKTKHILKQVNYDRS